MLGLASSGHIAWQGEVVVGDTEGGDCIPLPKMECSRVWFGAPTADHAKGSANTGTIFIGGKHDHAGQIRGGVPLEKDNYTGFTLLLKNTENIALAGLNAGDAVEVQIWR